MASQDATPQPATAETREGTVSPWEVKIVFGVLAVGVAAALYHAFRGSGRGERQKAPVGPATGSTGPTLQGPIPPSSPGGPAPKTTEGARGTTAPVGLRPQPVPPPAAPRYPPPTPEMQLAREMADSARRFPLLLKIFGG